MTKSRPGRLDLHGFLEPQVCDRLVEALLCAFTLLGPDAVTQQCDRRIGISADLKTEHLKYCDRRFCGPEFLF